MKTHEQILDEINEGKTKRRMEEDFWVGEFERFFSKIPDDIKMFGERDLQICIPIRELTMILNGYNRDGDNDNGSCIWGALGQMAEKVISLNGIRVVPGYEQSFIIFAPDTCDYQILMYKKQLPNYRNRPLPPPPPIESKKPIHIL